MLNKVIETRIQRYAALKTVVEEKGRLPFHKDNQKYAKFMMFMYETMLEMASKPGLQNNTGLLYKISFIVPQYKAGVSVDSRTKILVEYAIRPGTSRMRSFEFNHTTKVQFVCALQSFADFYGLKLMNGEEKYTRTSKDHPYTICLPTKEA